MKLQEIRSLTKEELIAKQNEFKQQLFTLNYQRKFGRVEKPHLFKEYRKNIAKIKTILKEKTDESTKGKA